MRMKTTTEIQTQEGARISKRLLNHWKHKFEVSQTDLHMQIFMPEYTITLTPHAEILEVMIESQQLDLTHIQNVVLNHLNRMANSEFSATWQ